MSKKARELAERYFDSAGFQHVLAEGVDAAVAPLVDSVTDAPLPETLDYTNPEDFMRRYKQWHEGAQKALEGWTK